MTDPYMLDVQVEIAFDSGYTTPDASRTWTDVSSYVELAQGGGVTFGRQDELSTADANRLTLTLDNSDGRFTAGRAASPYYPNVKIGRPVRVTATPPGGSDSVRFVGFIDQWPVEWDGSDAYAKATVTAGSRLSRLGLSQKLRSVVEAEILADGPSMYWTMGDPSGATQASESSGNAGPALTLTGSGAGTVTFGNATGPGTDGLTACEFTVSGAERFLIASLPAGTTTTNGFAVGCFFSTTATGINQLLIGHPSGDYGTELSLIGMDTTGKVVGGIASGGSIQVTSANSYNDGSTHHAFVTISGGTLTLYVDGVSVGSAGGVAARTLPELRVGQQFNGALAHVEVYAGSSPSLPSAGRIAAHAAAGLTGFSGERTDERLGRILGWAGVTSSEIDAATGDETMTYQLTSGQSVVDALRDVESTEGGVLFDGTDGRVTFHNRSHRYQAAVAVTFDMAEQQVESDYAPKLDRSTLVNTVRVENSTTGWAADAVDATSADEYGTVTGSAKALTDTYPPLVQKAAWLVFSYAEPRPRVPSLTVDVLAQVGGTPSADDILALTIGSRIKVVNQPAQADATEADYFVEGYTESIGPESYRITFNLSPAHPSLSVLILDDATRGLLDTGVLAL